MMKKDIQCFNILQSSPIYIYGGGHLGVSTCNMLLGAGYNVVGVLDRNRNIDIKTSIKVYCHGEEPFIDGACIFICLNNGLQHTSVARMLRARGYKKIIFLPLLINTMAAKKMISIFNCLMVKDFAHLKNIPLYDEIWKLFIEDYFLREEEAFVTVMIPSSLVYTGKSKISDHHPFEDYTLDVTDNYPGFEFDSPLNTSKFFELNGFKERPDLILFFHNALSNDFDFFIDAASPAQFNSKGYFNLLDGHHRAYFLIQNKFFSLPLRVLKAEYEQYFNHKAANALMEYCKELDELPLKIMHPAFVRFPVNNNLFDEKFNVLHNALKYSKGVE